MLKAGIVLLLIFNWNSSFSQIDSRKEDQITFAWQVKQVDEFIERFNNQDSSFIAEFIKKNAPSIVLTREKLLNSLFNSEDKKLKIDDIKSFIKEVDNKTDPLYINFFDEDWCAIVNCSVTWKSKPENVVLTLKIKKFTDESSKWVITGVNAKFLKEQRINDSITNHYLTAIPPARDSTSSLHPYSHATGFMNIDKVSKDKANIKNYFLMPANPNKDELLIFINEILSNHLAINKVTSLHYDFYQIKGWTFEVREYDRQSRHSGWLISKLTRVPDKLQYDE